MSSTKTESNSAAPTRFIETNGQNYAYRRFGCGSGLPLLLLQHFTGTLDNWDPAVTDPVSGPNVASAQTAAFREWEVPTGQRFADLRDIPHPTLVVNGVHDEMIPVVNSYRLAENLPNAVLLTYPDAAHGSLFQYPESFTRHAAAFLSSPSESAAF